MRNTDTSEAPGRLRVDKWLWAARFFKTRGLAQDAVEGDKVRLNGERIKPAHGVRVGDRLDIHVAGQNWTVTVAGVADRRGPATEARRLYLESPESQAERERQAAERHWNTDPGSVIHGRPTKRDRRLIHRFNEF